MFFDNFGDSSLDFRLGIWTSTYTDKPEFLKSEIYFAIFKNLEKIIFISTKRCTYQNSGKVNI